MKEMAKYRNGSHTVYDIKYHFVWITKYRYKILKGNVAFRLRELLVQGCEAYGIKILVLVKKWVGKYSIIYTASKLCVAMSFTV